MSSIIKNIPVLLAIILTVNANFVHAEIALIAHPSNVEQALTPEQVKHIFLGKTGNFPGGNKVVPVDQKMAAH